MPSWEETRAHLRGRFLLAIDEETGVLLQWRFSDGPNHVLQEQRLEVAEAGGQDVVVVRALVARLGALDPVEALRHNDTLVAGALAVSEEHFFVRAVLPLEGLSFDRLEHDMKIIAHEAARLRRVDTATANYAD